jgi:hypothetical protein
LAFVLALVLIPFSSLVILTWTFIDDVLDADVYIQALDESGFFQVPYQLIREGEIPQVGGLLLEQGPLSAVSGVYLEEVALLLAPSEWLRSQLEREIREFVALARASDLDELPAFTISLAEVKARARGQPGDQALAVVLAALPECTQGQSPFGVLVNQPACKPAGLDEAAFRDELKLLLIPLVERLPDTYRVSWQAEQRDVLNDLQRASEILSRLRVVLLFMIVMNLALLGLIWFLVVRSPAEWLRWTGVPLFFIGILVFLGGRLIPGFVEAGLSSSNLWQEIDLHAQLVRTLEQAMQYFAQSLFQSAVLLGAVLAGTGLLLALLSFLFPGRPKRRIERTRRPRGRAL